MSLRVLILTLVALIAAAGTTMLVRGWIAAERAAVRVEALPAPAMPEVLVAAEALPAGLVLKPQHVHWQAWPPESVREDYFVRGRDEVQAVVGSVARNGIGPGEPVSESRIVRPGDRGFLAAILTPGKRAVSVPINASSGIAGLIFPGDRVDVILTHTIGAEAAPARNERLRRASETVLENIRVLAIDQRTEHEAGSGSDVGKTATLEVNPKQAEALVMLTELGRLSLSLRSLEITPTAPDASASPELADAGRPSRGEADDEGATGGQSYTLDSAVSVLLDPPAERGRRNQGWHVTVVRGGEVQQVTSDGVIAGPPGAARNEPERQPEGATAASAAPIGR